MRRAVPFAAALMLIANAAVAQETTGPQPWAMPGEETVDPYTVSDANAGTGPITDPKVFAAFNGREGVARIVATTLDLAYADARIGPIFKPFERARVERTLTEHFCYVLGGGCAYTGRDMNASHKDMGVKAADMGRLVELLQIAMDKEGVPFAMQNRFLAKLAPMKRDVIQKK
ncbi:group 1 truncated hemoglobin [Caulobacter sp. SLTY]|uniref:group I truncated hemoglobin n=1 Tax=Caulobacter sp. SLTY TaxID=2683262 RepID=UPI00196A7655|nr:group 1 truncated hemoglobin [Caulobacter sp. SLTY]